MKWKEVNWHNYETAIHFLSATANWPFAFSWQIFQHMWQFWIQNLISGIRCVWENWYFCLLYFHLFSELVCLPPNAYSTEHFNLQGLSAVFSIPLLQIKHYLVTATTLAPCGSIWQSCNNLSHHNESHKHLTHCIITYNFVWPWQTWCLRHVLL